MSATISDRTSDQQAAAGAGVLRNHVKEKLARGEVVASMTVRLVRGIEIARIAKTAGFDSLYVDLEHSSFSLETRNTSAWARVTSRPAPTSAFCWRSAQRKPKKCTP
jgi:hypothetical protein